MTTGTDDAGPLDVLVAVAHPDDETLGCGGAVARWTAEGRRVGWLVLADGVGARHAGAPPAEEAAARRRAAEEAAEVLGVERVVQHGLPDNRLDTVPQLDLARLVEDEVRAARPTTVVTHHGGDVNADHRAVHEAVLVACRPQPGHPVRRLLAMEVASSTEWRPPDGGRGFAPTVFVDTSATHARKLAALDRYAAELRPAPHPRSPEALTALARWRGATVGVDLAEAFVLLRELS